MESKIRKGLSARRSVDSYQTQADILIPAGTILRGVDQDTYAAGVGLGPSMAGEFTVTIVAGAILPDVLKRVVAA